VRGERVNRVRGRLLEIREERIRRVLVPPAPGLCSAFGALAGLALAYWADKALMAAYLPSDSGGLKISTAPDLRILLFTLAVTVITGVFFGLVPALQTTKPNVASTLKDEAAAVVGGGHGEPPGSSAAPGGSPERRLARSA